MVFKSTYQEEALAKRKKRDENKEVENKDDELKPKKKKVQKGFK